MEEKLKVVVDVNRLTFGDLETLTAWSEAGDNVEAKEIKALLELLNRVVEGGVKDIPIIYLDEIADKIMEAIAASQNPTVKSGKSATKGTMPKRKRSA